MVIVMSILEVNNLYFGYDDKSLFSGASLRLEPSEHMGIVGANGVGKTTLMNLIAHKITPDMGEITWLNNIGFSYLDQHLKVYDDITISDYLYKVYTKLFEKEEEMNKLYESLVTVDESMYDKILTKADNIQVYLEENDFYKIKSKISSVINGLGMDYDFSWPLKNLSSGQRGKVFLAKMLLEEKDVLLLDEPTNFLDVSHIEWLSKFLNTYSKAFIVISHNNEFLNSVCNVIVELQNKKLTRYRGNYEAYIMQKTARDEEYIKNYEAQQKYIKKTQEFIDKNIVRASTTRRAQSRRKELEKVEVMDKPVAVKKIKFSFPFASSYNMEAVTVKGLEIGYTKAILPKISLKIRFGEKVVIIGKNGVGKSTFLKTILGIIKPISGEYKVNYLNKITYYAQEIGEDIKYSAVQYIKNDYPLMDDKSIRDLLGRYGIIGDLAIKDMDKLSGGELTKVRFAKLSLEKSNLLILDEPTNHLDKNAKASLFKAIEEYPGTVIIVSHEKDFYKKLKMKEVYFG